MPMDRKNYPPNWPQFSKAIRDDRAKGRCECKGECGQDHQGRCEARNGGYRILGITVWFETLVANAKELKSFFDLFKAGNYKASKIVLTVAHLHKHGCEYTPPYCAKRRHVKAMCQQCHLRYDKEQRSRNAARTRRRKKNNLDLFVI
jgi:hypothetical protein